MYTPVNQFYYIKVGFKGVKYYAMYRDVFVMNTIFVTISLHENFILFVGLKKKTNIFTYSHSNDGCKLW